MFNALCENGKAQAANFPFCTIGIFLFCFFTAGQRGPGGGAGAGGPDFRGKGVDWAAGLTLGGGNGNGGSSRAALGECASEAGRAAGRLGSAHERAGAQARQPGRPAMLAQSPAEGVGGLASGHAPVL